MAWRTLNASKTQRRETFRLSSAPGLTEESIYSCLFNVRGGKLLNDPPPKHLLAGFDHSGNALELITIEEEDRNLLIVIHAMKLRKENMYLLEGDY